MKNKVLDLSSAENMIESFKDAFVFESDKHEVYDILIKDKVLDDAKQAADNITNVNGDNFSGVLHSFAILQSERKALKKEADAIKKLEDKLAGMLIDHMLDNDIASIKTKDGTIYIRSQLWAKFPDMYIDGNGNEAYLSATEKTNRLVTAMEKAGLYQYVKTSVDSRSFSTYLRGIQKEEPLEELNKLLPDINFTFRLDDGKEQDSTFKDTVKHSTVESLVVRK